MVLNLLTSCTKIMEDQQLMREIEFIVFNISVHEIGRFSNTIILANNTEIKYIYLL